MIPLRPSVELEGRGKRKEKKGQKEEQKWRRELWNEDRCEGGCV